MGKEETAEFILQKVAPIFNRKGYVGTSMSDLTEATRLTKGAIYGNFSNKEDLALKAFKYNAKHVLGPLKLMIDSVSSGHEKMNKILLYHRTYSHRISDIGGCPILNVGIDARHVNPKLFALAKEISSRMMEDLKKILELGIEDGSFKKDINTSLLAKNIYAMIDGGVFMTSTHEDDAFLQNMLDAVEFQIIQPILKSKSA